MIAVTGATGQLGRLVIEDLLNRGTTAGQVVALARSPEKADALAARGVQVRVADYTKPEGLVEALAGVERLLLVSGNVLGERVAQHRNVVTAAHDAGVKHLAYTSILRAASNRIQLAAEHRETEEIIRASGLPFTMLGHSWYIENYTRTLATTLERGVMIGSADGGRVSAAARADYAAAAAAVLTGSGHEGRAYELGGDQAFTLGEFAAELARQSGQPVEYRDLSESAHVEALLAAGVPDAYARIGADTDQGIARGELFTDSGDLHRLIGRPTTSFRDVIAAALRR